MKIELNGIFVPHITPFTQKEKLDENALRECVRFWVKNGVAGLVPCGSNGEAVYMSRDERKRVIEIVLDETNDRVSVLAGTGSMSTRETELLTADAKDLGVDAALVVTPYYYKLSDREIYEHYKVILESVDLPMVIYNVPKFTGYSINPLIVAKLASEYDNLIGVKDSSGAIGSITEIIRLTADKISVLAGTGDIILSTLMLGGKGAIVAVANVFPQICSSLFEAFAKGEYAKASSLQRRISYLNDILVKKHNQLSSIKEALKLEGLPAGRPRRPCLPLTSQEKRYIRRELVQR